MDDLDKQLLEYIDNFEVFAKECVVIRDHDTSMLLPFIFNNGQKILHAIVEKQKKEKGYVKLLLLKSRRFGGSTYVEGRYYWKASMNENRNVFIVGHEERSTATLFAMAKLAQERNPIAPATRKSNAQQLIFDNAKGTGLKSQYELATARNLTAGRSQGIHYLHFSEEAYYEHGGELLDGLMACVPMPPAETEIIRESTAQGYGNTFQIEAFRSYSEGQYPYYEKDGIVYAWYNPKTNWIVVFIPWFVHARYTLEFDSEQKKIVFAKVIEEKVFDAEEVVWVDSEALQLKRQYKLTLEQLHWREWAIENVTRGNIDKFHQEFPATFEEAFLSSGNNVFPKVLCDDIEKGCEDPIIIGDVAVRGSKTIIRTNPHGHFSIWERQADRETYFMTVDVAGGKTEKHTTEKTEPDYTVIDVWNHRTGVQVAQWHGHIDYDLIGDLVEMIGKMYDYAPACVELLNHGYTVVADLERLNYPMYESRPRRPGFMPTRTSKPRMVDDLYRFVKGGEIQIRCKQTVSEMRTFIEESRAYGAASGCKDDRVITAGMASQMMLLLPKKFRKLRRRSMRIKFGNFGRKK